MYSKGGWIPSTGNPVQVKIPANECIISRHGFCQRQDEAHMRTPIIPGDWFRCASHKDNGDTLQGEP